MENDIVVFACDSNGIYLGLTPKESAYKEVFGPPPENDGEWIWDFNLDTWMRKPNINILKNTCLDDIDRFAGVIRVKFLTHSPGQTLTYMIKVEQANTFIKNLYLGIAPGLVRLEAQVQGITNRQAADSIILKHTILSAIITRLEAIRLVVKNNIRDSNDMLQIVTLRNDAINQMKTIE